MAAAPPGYRFLRVVLIVGATGFGLLAVFYLLNGQYLPGLFALFISVIEIAALPLFRKLLGMSRPGPANERDDKG
jgi:hypothetical protein